VFTLGRTVLVLLGDASTNPDGFRDPVELLRVAARACQPRPEQRYEGLAEFCAAWRAARGLARRTRRTRR
jgi:hypothetical protein